MQRIPSGVTDQKVYFVAVDATDLKTFETGLATWTVFRSRNGAAEAAWTTPTISEIDLTNCPGLYALTVDEDTTIDAGDACQVMALRITHAGMAPVTVLVELFIPPVTAGETITVSSGAVSSVTTTATATAVTTVNGIAAGAITAAAIANGAIDAATFAAGAIDAAALAADAGTEIATAVWASGTRSLTVLDEDSTTLDLDTTIRAAVGLATANLDTQLADLPTNAELATALGTADDAVLTAIGDLPTNAELATALGTADDAVLAQIALVKAQTDLIPSDPADASVIAGRFDTLDTSIADLPTNAELTTALGTADDAVLAQIALVKAKTDSLTFTVAGEIDANIQSVNDVTVTGDGQTGTEWGPA
jgi:hypothetical protein